MCQLCRIGPLSAPHQEVQQEGGQTMNDGVFTVETHPQNFSTAILAVMDEANKDLILGSFKVTTLLLKDGTKRRDLASILARYIEGGFQGAERVQWEKFFDTPFDANVMEAFQAASRQEFDVTAQDDSAELLECLRQMSCAGGSVLDALGWAMLPVVFYQTNEGTPDVAPGAEGTLELMAGALLEHVARHSSTAGKEAVPARGGCTSIRPPKRKDSRPNSKQRRRNKAFVSVSCGSLPVPESKQ